MLEEILQSIPTIIKSEIPFPIPLSVIFLLTTWQIFVPVTRIITEENKIQKN
jgi:hypothetical protein